MPSDEINIGMDDGIPLNLQWRIINNVRDMKMKKILRTILSKLQFEIRNPFIYGKMIRIRKNPFQWIFF